MSGANHPTQGKRSGLLRWTADQILAWLQARCEHPGMMVAADVLEGSGRGVEVAYCRRCGSIKVTHGQFPGTWRPPSPNLWRGR